MKYKLKRSILVYPLLVCFVLPFVADAQTKQQYSSLSDALNSGGYLEGDAGPQSVNWTNSGNKYSYIVNNEIRSMDPQTLKDELVFKNEGVNFPASGNPFEYESFQWSKDARHLVFKTNFRPIYRKSGVADYYIYDLQAKQLKQAAKDARTAELSPDGSKVGIERNGNMFVYNF